MQLLVKKLRDNMKMPKYAHGIEDSGMDLYIAAIATQESNWESEYKEYILRPNEVVLCKAGFAIAVPIGYEAQIRPTSGNSLKTMLRLPNSPGTLDAGFRGEVGIIIQNIGRDVIDLKEGAKIAQMVICPVMHPQIEMVEELPVSARMDKGYGSTGLATDNK